MSATANDVDQHHFPSLNHDSTNSSSSLLLDSVPGVEPAETQPSPDPISSLEGSPGSLDRDYKVESRSTVSPNELSLSDRLTTGNSSPESSETPLAHAAPAGSTGESAESDSVTANSGNSIGLLDHVVVKEENSGLLDSVKGQIELLEGSSEIVVGAGDNGLIVEENQEWIPDPDHELKRVKVRSFTCYFSFHRIFLPFRLRHPLSLY